jgi:hypothetical protein
MSSILEVISSIRLLRCLAVTCKKSQESVQ